MTVWVLIIVTTVGPSIPAMISYARVSAHYSTKNKCTNDRDVFLADVAAGRVLAGGAECLEVKPTP